MIPEEREILVCSTGKGNVNRARSQVTTIVARTHKEELQRGESSKEFRDLHTDLTVSLH